MKLFSRKQSERTEEGTTATLECPHLAAVPRWDNLDDIGHEDRATAFYCEACRSTFTPEEYRAIQQAAHERLQQIVEAN
jgi:hypothetical protein